jgi:hypothetical protein
MSYAQSIDDKKKIRSASDLTHKRPNIHINLNQLKNIKDSDLIALYMEHGYVELYNEMRYRQLTADLATYIKDKKGSVKNNYVKRYWLEPRPLDRMVYNANINNMFDLGKCGISVQAINDSTTINPSAEEYVAANLARHYKLPSDDIIEQEIESLDNLDGVKPKIPRLSDDDKDDVNINMSVYNGSVYDRFTAGIVHCIPILIKQPVDITDNLIYSLDTNKYASLASYNDIIDAVLLDVRKFMVDALYGVNPNIRNRRELLYGNSNIIFDVVKGIYNSLRSQLYESDIVVPAITRDDKMNTIGKLQRMIRESVSNSSIKTQRRGIETTICI